MPFLGRTLDRGPTKKEIYQLLELHWVMIIFTCFAFSYVHPMWLPERRQVYLSASQDDLICGLISSLLKKYDSNLFSPDTSVLIASMLA